MIQLNQYSVWVRLADGKQVPLLPEDMAKWYCQAHPSVLSLQPWQVEELAGALVHHLRENLEIDTISLEQCVALMSRLMIVCGLQTEPDANLYRLAQDTGNGFELAFFQSVKRSIQEYHVRNARLIRFVGLRSCVKFLAGSKNWGKTCQRLNDEIVDYIRSQMQQRANGAPVAFVVSP